MPNPYPRSQARFRHIAAVWEANGLGRVVRITEGKYARDTYLTLEDGQDIGVAPAEIRLREMLGEIPPQKTKRPISQCPKQARKRERYASDPAYRLRYVTAKSMRKGLKGLSTGSVRDLPYSFSELRDHLERQFRKGMSWENYGTTWQIDHYYPVSAFDLTDPVQFQKCWALVNLRPLESDKNLRKHAVVPDGFEEYLNAP